MISFLQEIKRETSCNKGVKKGTPEEAAPADCLKRTQNRLKAD
ncbi:hypothetical protein [Morganella morganii IS15]|nr:hypothetical protein CSB69_0187 [Morganella morganii]EMP52070.1 hypothetical protein C790_00540 [Morganella morganii SC01]ETO44866.1 hypothetical protein X965_00280 [Morganella sp. EGD-HP17]CDK65048.1 hypothetical protein [Morganella morganii IS15]